MVEQNKECLIQISKYKFSLVISGLTKILQRVNESVSRQDRKLILLVLTVFSYCFWKQRTHGPDYEKNYYESLLIVLDTLEKCLSGQPKDTTRFDEAMNVKLLLREICQFIGKLNFFLLNFYSPSCLFYHVFADLPNENAMVNQLKALASKVLFALSLNNFNAVFSRISSR